MNRIDSFSDSVVNTLSEWAEKRQADQDSTLSEVPQERKPSMLADSAGKESGGCIIADDSVGSAKSRTHAPASSPSRPAGINIAGLGLEVGDNGASGSPPRHNPEAPRLFECPIGNCNFCGTQEALEDHQLEVHDLPPATADDGYCEREEI